jgi:hypothetical protein
VKDNLFIIRNNYPAMRLPPATLILILCLLGLALSCGCMFLNPLSALPSPTEDENPGILIKVTYDKPWSGAVGYAGNTKSIEGTGTTTFSIGKPGRFVSVNAQKGDKSRDRLTIEIIKNGKVIASEFTDASYGVASTSAPL